MEPNRLELTPHPRYVTWRDPLWRRFHAVGVKVCAGAWDARRHALCGYVTRGRTASSRELYPDEMIAIITLLEEE